VQTPDERLQLAAPKLPPAPPSEKVSTVPVGVMLVPGLVSVIVNVHVVAKFGAVGGQLMPVEVFDFVAEIEACPELNR